MRRIGGIYDLGDGLRLQDVDGGCGSCGKRLAEVIHDPSNHWRTRDLVCLDCGQTYPPEPPAHVVRIDPSHKYPGTRVAVCSCGYVSQPGTTQQAATLAENHRRRSDAA